MQNSSAPFGLSQASQRGVVSRSTDYRAQALVSTQPFLLTLRAVGLQRGQLSMERINLRYSGRTDSESSGNLFQVSIRRH